MKLCHLWLVNILLAVNFRYQMWWFTGLISDLVFDYAYFLSKLKADALRMSCLETCIINYVCIEKFLDQHLNPWSYICIWCLGFVFCSILKFVLSHINFVVWLLTARFHREIPHFSILISCFSSKYTGGRGSLVWEFSSCK